ncbi:MAG: cyanophycin synthetase [Polyangiaceae bacterium]
MTSQLAEEAFASAEVGGGAGRLVPVQVGRDVVVIDDSYNANPASMKASIRAAAEIAADQKRRLILVLGEMRELGVAAEAGHDEVGDAARESGARLVIAVGPLAKRIANKVKGGAVTCAHAANAEEASALARQWVMPSDLVLVKGSRGIGTDAVVRALTAHLGSESVAAQSAGGTP